MPRHTTVGIVQMCATADVEQNLETAVQLIGRATNAGAEIVFLPESFAFIGPDCVRNKWLESLDTGGPILDACIRAATDNNVDLIAGGFPEYAGNKMAYNTCLHITPYGKVAAKYRKIHLFDVDLADGTRLRESEDTLPGTEATVTELPFGILGLSICYDLRFPRLYQDLIDRGAVALAVPAAFTKTTGKDHWHVLLRARAIECQAYIIAPAQYGPHEHDNRQSFGHALIAGPWGNVIAECEADQDGIAIGIIDPAEIERVRTQLPSLRNQRKWE